MTTYIRYPSGDWRNFRYAYQWNPADDYRTPTRLTRPTRVTNINTNNLNFTAVNNRGQAITEPATWAFFSQIPAKLITLPGFARSYPSGLEPTAETTLPNLGFITAAHWGALTLQQLTGLATPTDPTQPAAGKSSFVCGKIGSIL